LPKLYSVSELVPHKGKMCFLSSIESYDEGSLHAKAHIQSSNPFLVEGSVSSWIGIEYMAQAIAAWAGTEALEKGEPVKVGLLVGTRKYVVDSPKFLLDSELNVYVKKVLQAENGLGVFDCRIENEGNWVEASINVYLPDDIRTILGGPSR
jgi:predicted hotdog family 3-hydroxylacyl-ACP dehydratase